MQFVDKETVAGTRVTIGRRAQHRKVSGTVDVRASATYTAEYIDVSGKRRFESLSTTVKREARRKAIEIQSRLDEGLSSPGSARTRLPVAQLVERYLAHVEAKGLARKTHARYRVELEKLIEFCQSEGIERAMQVDEEVFHRFGAFLRSRAHKQSGSGGGGGRGHAPKTVYTALTVCKQAYKWAWRVKVLPEFPLASARLPKGKPRPQPCFTTAQVEAMLAATAPDSLLHRAVAILAYSGLRVGELEQLRWEDVRLDVGDLGVIHVRRGGSSTDSNSEDAAPKDKDHRVVPIHPRIRPILNAMACERSSEVAVMADLRARTLLTHLKRLCGDCGFPNAERFKTHALRHHFASMCANKGVPYRLVLSWLGHSSSDILDLYYHLFDEESRAAMRALADKGR